METESKTVSIDALNKAFAKIAKYVDKYQLSVLETELRKMVPSNNSVVTVAAGSDFNDNYLTLNIFVTNPLPISETLTFDFLKIINECIIKANFEKLYFVMESINDIEKRGINKYELDLTEPDYEKDSNQYYIHIVISKLLK